MAITLSPSPSPDGCVVPAVLPSHTAPHLGWGSTSSAAPKLQGKDRHCQCSLTAPPVTGTSSPCQQLGPSSSAPHVCSGQRPRSLPQECHPPADPDSHPVSLSDSADPESGCPYPCALSKPGHVVSTINGNYKPTPMSSPCPHGPRGAGDTMSWCSTSHGNGAPWPMVARTPTAPMLPGCSAAPPGTAASGSCFHSPNLQKSSQQR